MATRSAIAVQTSRGLRAVYCHWDGYPTHHLPILESHYRSAAKAAALIRPGDISCLRTRSTWATGATLRTDAGDAITDAEGNWRYEGDREPQPLYYSERGDRDIKPQRFATVDDLMRWADGSGCEHVYVFVPRHGWRHTALCAGVADTAPMPGCDPAHW